MKRRFACLRAAALAALAACSGASNAPVRTTLMVTATQTSVVANGRNSVTVHVEGATRGPLKFFTTRGSFASGSTQQVDGTSGDAVLTTCNAATDGSCAGSFDVLASDADGNAGHVSLRFSSPGDCASNCALDVSCVGQACTTTTGGTGTCTGSPAACLAAGGACTATETAEKTCSDGLDNDCNGSIDCADTGCDGQPCKTGDPTWTCQAKACTQTTTGYAIEIAPARTRLPAAATTAVVVKVKSGSTDLSGVPVTLTASAGTPATATQTTAGDGTASFSYTAPNAPGTVTLTASFTPAVGAKLSLDAKITVPNLGSLALGSVLYDVMGVKGSAYREQNQLVVQVLDDQGLPYPDGLAVTFTHPGVAGSALAVTSPDTASCTSGTACTAAASTTSPADQPDSAGLASAYLVSGTMASPYQVTATATAGGVTRTFTFPTLFSIGAKASGLDFAVDCSPRNVPALAETNCSTSYVDATFTCVARLKDRFGNLLGRDIPVMFRSEASGYGHVQTTPEFDPTKSAAVQATLGSAVELFQTHLDGLPSDVAPFELASDGQLEPRAQHAIDGCGTRIHNPRDGVVTVIALADGEESFTDVNGNGVYDPPGSPNLPPQYRASGEPYVSLGDPYVDANDNGMWDPGEWYFDADGDGAYTPPGGRWKATTKIWTQTKVVYTGTAVTIPVAGNVLGTRWADEATYQDACTATAPASDFSLTAGTPPPDSAQYFVVASDLNLNVLAETTSYAAATEAPGQAVTKYYGLPKIADTYGFSIRQWACVADALTEDATHCANECPASASLSATDGSARCVVKPRVSSFSCGYDARVTLTGGAKADGVNLVEWKPLTTYPVYGESHVSTGAWLLTGKVN